MKILLATGIYPPESGGPATFSAGVSAVLRQRGHEVKIISYGEHPNVSDEVVWVSRRGGPLVRYCRYMFRAWRLAKDAQIVFVQGAVSEGVPATIAACAARRPVVMRIPGDYAWEMSMQRGGTVLLDEFLKRFHGSVIGLYERLERWTTRHAAHVVVPSMYLKRVVEQWGIEARKIDVVVNAAEAFPPMRSRAVERAELEVTDEILFLTPVRAVPWKGVAELISWWSDLPERYVLAVAGDGPELSMWQDLARRLALGSRVRFMGRVDKNMLARWYHAADALILHSGYEGYPFVVAEAATFGLPCFVSDQGGNPETHQQFGDLVTIVPYRDRGAWVRVLSAFEPTTETRTPRIAQTYAAMVDQIEQVLQTYAKTI